MFHRVLAKWHHKAELKVKALEQTVAEVMPLNHTELAHWLLTNGKLHSVQTNNHSAIHTANNMVLIYFTLALLIIVVLAAAAAAAAVEQKYCRTMLTSQFCLCN